jgi:pimeloyl-ACP methyl ester carboxylesterase
MTDSTKTVLLVPGFQEGLTTHNYRATISAIESKGYKVVFVPISWKRATLDDWVAQLNAVYQKHDPQNTILAGFSYGSMVALTAGSQRLPAELWLFSLSPYFAEDIPLLKREWLRNIGKRRQESFAKLSFDKLAAAITCKTLLFIGETEAKKYPLINRRAEQAHKLLPSSQLIRIPNCDHDVTSKPYVQAIKQTV